MTATTVEPRTATTTEARPERRQSRALLITGRVMTALVVAFLAVDSFVHIAQVQVALDAFEEMGWPHPAATSFWIGVCMAVSLVLYLTPKTNILGALFITAYLGGAVAANVQADNGFFGYVLAPVYTAVLVWGGLWARDAEVRKVLPFRR